MPHHCAMRWRWAGQKPLPGGGFGRFAIKARTNVSAGPSASSSVNVELDGNAAEGVLTFAADGRQTLQGTLAADTLDLTPLCFDRPSSDQPMSASWSTGADHARGILRFRPRSAAVGRKRYRLQRQARPHRDRRQFARRHLVVTVGEAQAYGGVIKGSLAFAEFDQGVEVKSQLQFTDVDLESMPGRRLFGLRRLEGKGTCRSRRRLRRQRAGCDADMNGTATLTGTDGALAGLNVEQLLRRLERRPLSGGGEFRTGRTPYEKIAIALKIAKGMVTVDDVIIEGAAVKLALAGTASIPERELDLKGTAALVAPPRPGVTPFELPFIVQGSWDDPIMLPDPEALIRRSGAAAPLSRALQERNARDSVRRAIERLTGGTPSSGTIPAADQTAPETQQKAE